jgi:hypothetical protein
MFKRKFNNKRGYIPNRMRNTPVIGFKAKLSPGCMGHLKDLKKNRKMNKFINESIERNYLYITDPESYLKQLIESNYYFIRRLVRKVGRENGKNKM